MKLTRLIDALVIETPNARTATLASPSRDGSALAVWQVSMQPGQAGSQHAVDADQVHVVVAGRLAATVDGDTSIAEVGDAVLLPAGSLRVVATEGDAPVRALVSMPARGRVSLPDGSDRGVVPWAE